MRKIFTFFCAALMSAGMFAEEVATPVISGEIEFTDSVIVTMSCATESADIYYTTDGVTDPKCDCAAAPEYKHPIVIKETTTIKAAAYTGNDWSEVAEVTFTKVPAPEAKYYIVGDMTNWVVSVDYEMTPSNVRVDEVEEYKFEITLTTANQFKVVKVDGETQTWYPDGMGNAYGENGEIKRDGDYTIYFRPALDGDEDWFYNCIMAIRHATPERVVVGVLFPANGKPTEGVKIFGSFSEEEFDMTLITETGAYIHTEIMAADQDEFMFRDAADEENVLMERNAAGQWEEAVFTFDEEWEQDTWKDEPVKLIDMDLSDNSKYAWANAIPEGLEEVLTEKAESRKIMIDGMLYIVRDGKLFNLTGAQVK